ncbi:hypothetical protein GCM10007907_31010 [Chitinimonas prasina]|uniref:DUF2268 domain-containing protein n=1 Tax=Chitinimonas prasina TaxID=1434937 RepID=A0ABQ5YM06_9NEIS|nr:hypothetical protein [Chitinimonas prasina]GLR14311.1 hypothetical protein GCM10007907_31010 [Chitinimonas prasina]
MRQLILAALLATAGMPAFAATAKAPAKQAVQLEVKVRDLSPLFLDFYKVASAPVVQTPAAPATPAADGKQAAVPAAPAVPVESEDDRRWRLFKKIYNVSAHEDDAATRAALETAWPRYAAALPQITAGFDGIAAEPAEAINALSAQYFLDKPFSVRWITYVGAFEGRVWSQETDGIINVNLPLEVDAKTRALPLHRILSKVMQDKNAHFGSQPRNLAELLISEGVQAHVLRSTVPGHTVETYLNLSAEQLAQASSNRKATISTIITKLGDDSAATMGSYAGEQQAQTRYVGWLLVDYLVKKQKARYADLIRQKPADLAKASTKALAVINAGK